MYKMTPQQLKNSILQMAMQGKLVEQRPEEGTGEALYQEIQAEKEKLIQAGKIKKSKKLPEITEEEIPFEIPESWKWVRWGDLSQSIQYGYNAPGREKGRIKMVRITDIQDNKVYWDTVPFCEIEEDMIGTYLLKPNDILFARTGGTVGKSYLVKNVPEEAIYAGYLIRTRYSTLLCPEYLKYFMDSQLYWGQLRNGTIATAQPNCNGKTLSKMMLPLPSFAEQRRIAAKLEEIQPLLDRYEKAYNRLEAYNQKFPENLKKSILQYAIEGKLVEQREEEGTGEALYQQIQAEKKKLIQAGKIKKSKKLPEITEDEIPFEIPESWKWAKFGEIVDFFIGKTPKRHESQYWQKSEFPWVSISDLIDRGHIQRTKENISSQAAEKVFKNRFAPKGTLLMSFKLTIGKVSILDIDAFHNEAIISIFPIIERDNIFRDYLFDFLPLISAEGKTKSAIKGKTLNSNSLKNLLVPIPPLEEQKRIVAKVEELMPLVEKCGEDRKD